MDSVVWVLCKTWWRVSLHWSDIKTHQKEQQLMVGSTIYQNNRNNRNTGITTEIPE